MNRWAWNFLILTAFFIVTAVIFWNPFLGFFAGATFVPLVIELVDPS